MLSRFYLRIHDQSQTYVRAKFLTKVLGFFENSRESLTVIPGKFFRINLPQHSWVFSRPITQRNDFVFVSSRLQSRFTGWHEMTCPLAVKMGPIEGRMERAKLRYFLIVVARLRICKPFFCFVFSPPKDGSRHPQRRPWKLGIGSRFYLRHINAMH